MKKTIIFGNGLGRAIDNEFFSLPDALHAAWNDEDVLNEEQRELILRCLPNEVIEEEGAPSSEDQLDTLQQILAACDVINELETETAEGWLSDNGKAFPAAIRSYVHRAACEFHCDEIELPEEFAAPLREHIVEEKTHIATLNYYNLLYSNFIGTKVFDGYSCLIDGFRSQTFSSSHLQRRSRARTSYYLHLHGSPLYHDDSKGQPHKAPVANVDLIAGDRSGHIVLTNVKHKRSVIEASPILKAYWRMLNRAFNESKVLTLVGYSGLDEHLNQRINKRMQKNEACQLRIVEREAEGEFQDRDDYWSKIFSEFELIQLESVLEFRDW